MGAISGVNPLDNTEAGGRKKKFQGVAYTLEVIQDMLEKLPEPTRTVCATTAFTGSVPASCVACAGRTKAMVM